ncbi:heparinase II/III family protein [bacterium]|nr:heparinase II/III family protein [bacterium]
MYLLWPGISCALTETHPFIIYTNDDIGVIQERLSREPYASWFAELVKEADAILLKNVSWDKADVPKVTQSYYAKMLAFAYAFGDTAAQNHAAYGREAARCLFYIPGGGYTGWFSSDLDVSETAMFWCEAYDILKGAGYDFTLLGVPDMETTIRGKLSSLRDYMARDWNEEFFSPCIGRDFLSVAYISSGRSDNHHVKLYSALAALALVIYDESGSEADFSRARSRLSSILDTMTITGDNGEPAGGWAEGPNYYLYSLRQLYPAMTALNNRGILDFSTNKELANTHLWLSRTVMPDGYSPPYDDNEAVRFDLSGLLYYWCGNDSEKDMLRWMWEKTGRRVVREALPEYISQFDDVPPAHPGPSQLGLNPTDFYPESGFARFRNSWDNDAVYLLFLTEHGEANVNGQAHEHPDPNTFILHAYGEMLMLDSGYGGYAEHDKTRFPVNHNLILVDGEGPEEVTGSDSRTFWDGNAYLTEWFSSAAVDYALSKTRYRETDLYRSVLFPGHRYFIICDRVSGAADKKYTLLFHGNGGGTSGGTFSQTGSGGMWEREQAVCRTFTTGSSDLTFETEDMMHAVYARTPMLTHTVLKVSQTGSDERFLTVICPERTGGSPPDMSIADVANGSGVRVARADTVDYAFASSADSVATLRTGNGTYATDSGWAYVSESPGKTPLSLFFAGGTSMSAGSDTLAAASSTVTMSLDYSDSTRVSGYILTAGETDVEVYAPRSSKILFGGAEIPFGVHSDRVKFTVSGKGDLLIEQTGNGYALDPPYNVLVTDNGNDQGHRIRITWSLSPSEEQGAVEWYRIYRSQTSSPTDAVPITSFSDPDSLSAWEQHHTVLVDSVSAGRTEYIDSSVPLNEVSYYYWLQAAGHGAESGKVAADTVTGVEEKPAGFMVREPFPNPFNASTMLEYYLPESCHVTLAIHDILGMVVAMPEDSFLSAGLHRTLWNGTDDKGRQAASGIYIYRFVTPSFTASGKMLLLR